MSILETEGEAIRQALRWISEQRQADPKLKLSKAVDEASQRFDLSPLQADFLFQALLNAKKDGP